jgi:hypothetical protein
VYFLSGIFGIASISLICWIMKMLNSLLSCFLRMDLMLLSVSVLSVPIDCSDHGDKEECQISLEVAVRRICDKGARKRYQPKPLFLARPLFYRVELTEPKAGVLVDGPFRGNGDYGYVAECKDERAPLLV